MAGASASFLWKHGKHPWSTGGAASVGRGTSHLIIVISISPSQNSWLRTGGIQETVSTRPPLRLRFPSTGFYGGISHCSGHHCRLQGVSLPLGMNPILKGRSLSLQGLRHATLGLMLYLYCSPMLSYDCSLSHNASAGRLPEPTCCSFLSGFKFKYVLF